MADGGKEILQKCQLFPRQIWIWVIPPFPHLLHAPLPLSTWAPQLTQHAFIAWVSLQAGLTDFTHPACMVRRGTPHTLHRPLLLCLDERAGSPRGTLFPPSGRTGSWHACRGRFLEKLPTAALNLRNTYTPSTRSGLPVFLSQLFSLTSPSSLLIATTPSRAESLKYLRGYNDYPPRTTNISSAA